MPAKKKATKKRSKGRAGSGTQKPGSRKKVPTGKIKGPGGRKIRTDRPPKSTRSSKGQIPPNKREPKKEGPNPKTDSNPNGAGRYNTAIDWDEFDDLCMMQATLEEIAAWFGCSPDTIERKVKEKTGVIFAEYFAQKRAGGFISLRRAQWQVGVDSKNFIMLMFLGKQYLGQSDKVDTTVGSRVDYRDLKKAIEKGKTQKGKIDSLMDFLQKTNR